MAAPRYMSHIAHPSLPQALVGRIHRLAAALQAPCTTGYTLGYCLESHKWPKAQHNDIPLELPLSLFVVGSGRFRHPVWSTPYCDGSSLPNACATIAFERPSGNISGEARFPQAMQVGICDLAPPRWGAPLWVSSRCPTKRCCARPSTPDTTRSTPRASAVGERPPRRTS